ncbi:hypothetical protein PMAYCL1PPCAC_04823, partial [Pristionchus mayeri]
RDIEELVNRGMGYLDQTGRDRFMQQQLMIVMKKRVEYGRVLEAYNVGCENFDELKKVAMEQEFIEHQKRMASKGTNEMKCTECGGRDHSSRDHFKHLNNNVPTAHGYNNNRNNGHNNGGHGYNNGGYNNGGHSYNNGRFPTDRPTTFTNSSFNQNNQRMENAGGNNNRPRVNNENKKVLKVTGEESEQKDSDKNVTFLGRRLQMEMIVEGEMRDATVDSGAEVSLIPIKMLKDIVARNEKEWWIFQEQRMEPVDINVRVSNANAGPMNIVSQVILAVKKDKTDQTHNIGFFVTNDEQDEIILGVNSFDDLEIRFTMGKKDRPINNGTEQARVDKDLIVEPGQVTDLEVRGPKSEERLLWSTNDFIESGACTLDDNGITTIPILNNTNKAIAFNKGEVIGEWSTDSLSEEKSVHARVEYIAIETGIMSKKDRRKEIMKEEERDAVEMRVPSAKNKCINLNDVMVHDGILYLLDTNHKWKVYVPEGMRNMVMKDCHEGIGGGHFGSMKQCQTMEKRYYWGSMKIDVPKSDDAHPAHLDYRCKECTSIFSAMSMREIIMEDRRKNDEFKSGTTAVAASMRVSRLPITEDEVIYALNSLCEHRLPLITQLPETVKYEGEDMKIQESMTAGKALRQVLREVEQELRKSYLISTNSRFLSYTDVYEVYISPCEDAHTFVPIDTQLECLLDCHPGHFTLIVPRGLDNVVWQRTTELIGELASRGWYGCVAQSPISSATTKLEYEDLDELLELFEGGEKVTVATRHSELWKDFSPITLALGSDKSILPIWAGWEKRESASPPLPNYGYHPRGGNRGGSRGGVRGDGQWRRNHRGTPRGGRGG